MSKSGRKKVKPLRRFQRSRKWRLIGGAFVLIIVASLSLFYWQTRQDSLDRNVVIPEDRCIQNSDISFGCYKDQLQQVIRDNGSESAFALLKQQYELVPMVKSQCHQLVHVVGRAAYAKYNDLGETFTHGDPFCWSGYYHGVMEQLTKENGEETIKLANDICVQLRTEDRASFKHYNCVHGLGHGFMFILSGKLFDSLKACDNLTDSYENYSCYGGVFMQNIMNDQAPDKEIDYVAPYLKDDDPMYPCTAVGNRYKHQCYLMQTSHALKVVDYNFGRVFDLCDATEETYRETCYQSLGRDASGNTISDVDQTRNKCMLGRNINAKSHCIIGAVKDFVSYYHSDQQAKELCASLTPDLSETCSTTMKTYYASL